MTKDGKTSKEEIGKRINEKKRKESPEVIQKLQEIHHLHTASIIQYVNP